jgi:hypothetical protein
VERIIENHDEGTHPFRFIYGEKSFTANTERLFGLVKSPSLDSFVSWLNNVDVNALHPHVMRHLPKLLTLETNVWIIPFQHEIYWGVQGGRPKEYQYKYGENEFWEWHFNLTKEPRVYLKTNNVVNEISWRELIFNLVHN